MGAFAGTPHPGLLHALPCTSAVRGPKSTRHHPHGGTTMISPCSMPTVPEAEGTTLMVAPL